MLSLRSAAGERRVAARRVVLATGRDGLGGPFVPDLFRALDRGYWAHSSDDIDFAALRGKTVGVIGAGASAVDNAAEALEAGAARVAMLVRRPDVPRVNRGMGIGSPGMWHGFNRLTPAQRWSIVQHIADHAIPPPRNSMLRCSRHKNFSIVARCSPKVAAIEDRRVVLDTSRGRLAFDYLIVCTGFTVDWGRRPELASLAPHVALWRDRFQPNDRDSFDQADDPFLGADLQFLEKAPGACSLGRTRTLLYVPGLHEFMVPSPATYPRSASALSASPTGLRARCSRRTMSATGRVFSPGTRRSCAGMNMSSTRTSPSSPPSRRPAEHRP